MQASYSLENLIKGLQKVEFKFQYKKKQNILSSMPGSQPTFIDDNKGLIIQLKKYKQMEQKYSSLKSDFNLLTKISNKEKINKKEEETIVSESMKSMIDFYMFFTQKIKVKLGSEEKKDQDFWVDLLDFIKKTGKAEKELQQKYIKQIKEAIYYLENIDLKVGKQKKLSPTIQNIMKPVQKIFNQLRYSLQKISQLIPLNYFPQSKLTVIMNEIQNKAQREVIEIKEKLIKYPEGSQKYKKPSLTGINSILNSFLKQMEKNKLNLLRLQKQYEAKQTENKLVSKIQKEQREKLKCLLSQKEKIINEKQKEQKMLLQKIHLLQKQNKQISYIVQKKKKQLEYQKSKEQKLKLQIERASKQKFEEMQKQYSKQEEKIIKLSKINELLEKEVQRYKKQFEQIKKKNKQNEKNFQNERKAKKYENEMEKIQFKIKESIKIASEEVIKEKIKIEEENQKLKNEIDNQQKEINELINLFLKKEEKRSQQIRGQVNQACKIDNRDLTGIKLLKMLIQFYDKTQNEIFEVNNELCLQMKLEKQNKYPTLQNIKSNIEKVIDKSKLTSESYEELRKMTRNDFQKKFSRKFVPSNKAEEAVLNILKRMREMCRIGEEENIFECLTSAMKLYELLSEKNTLEPLMNFAKNKQKEKKMEEKKQ